MVHLAPHLVTHRYISSLLFEMGAIQMHQESVHHLWPALEEDTLLQQAQQLTEAASRAPHTWQEEGWIVTLTLPWEALLSEVEAREARSWADEVMRWEVETGVEVSWHLIDDAAPLPPRRVRMSGHLTVTRGHDGALGALELELSSAKRKWRISALHGLVNEAARLSRARLAELAAPVLLGSEMLMSHDPSRHALPHYLLAHPHC